MPLPAVLHVNYQPGGGWVLRILTRLHQSPSTILRDRVNDWGDGPLSQMGLAVATKFATLNRAGFRLTERFRQIMAELSDRRSEVEDCLHENAVFTFHEHVLPFELLLDIDSFIFEARSTYEIVGGFLREFFKRILDREITQQELATVLESEGLDTLWIEELRASRILFFHQTGAWFAVRVKSLEPLSIEPVILKRHVENLDDPQDYISHEELVAMSRGFESGLESLHRYVIAEIARFEETQR